MMRDVWTSRLASVRRMAFDSNALVYILEDRQPYAQLLSEPLRIMERGQAAGVLSVVVEMELLVGPIKSRDIRALRQAEMFLRSAPNLFVRPVDRVIARTAAQIRAETPLSSTDAMIAATAVEDGCQLIIGNDAFFARHFHQVPYLYLQDYLA